MSFTMRVEGFVAGETIPKHHTCEGLDVSPAMEWSGAPEWTKSFAVIVDDPDAPGGTWNHWLLWNIPVGLGGLTEGARAGVSGTNDFGKTGYGGPCPPKGHGAHRYFFRLYAVDAKSLNLKPGAKRDDLDRALHQHQTAEATYMGRYERK